MLRTWRCLALAAVASCAVSLEPPEGARITCGKNSACPSGFECAENLGYCVNAGTVIPALQVAFTLPRDGDDEVALSLTGVVVLNMDAKPPEQGVITLVSEDGLHDVPLIVSVAGAANSLILEAQDLLFPLTNYVLTVHPGIAPADGLLAVPSTESWTATFKTADSSDITPPEPVSGLVVERRSTAPQYSLRWTASTSTDISGVIAVRHSATPVSDAPENGRSYAVGQTVGESVVAFVGVASQATDAAPFMDPAYYAVHVFDTALNYSTPVQAAEGDFASVLWCPDHTGRFEISSPDQGTARLHATANEDDAFGRGVFAPDTTIPFDTVGTFSGGQAPFTIGGTVWLRPVITGNGATYVGPNRAQFLSNAELSVTSGHVELNMPATFSFQGQSWPAFEAERDTDPAAGAEVWVPATVVEEQVNVLYGTTGAYRVRVRPVVPGCPDAPWSVSPPFTAGTSAFVYVKAGATGQGLAPSDPAGTLASVQPLLDASTAVHVAEGTYNEAFNLEEGVEYYGGYTSTFLETARDPLLHPTTFTQARQVVFAYNGITAATVIDGFHITTTATDLGGNIRAVNVSRGGPVISHNVITTDESFWGNAGIYVADGSPTILHNTITSSITIWLQQGTGAVVDDNEKLSGSSFQRGALHCEGCTLQAHRNLISHRGSSGDAVALWLAGDANADIIGNRIQSSTTATSGYAAGIRLGWGQARIFNNEIYGGNGQYGSGIWFETRNQDQGVSPAGAILVSNNTIHPGTSTGNPGFGSAAMGIFMHSSTDHIATGWTIRITNNLIFGAGVTSFIGFAIEDNFSGLASIESNLVAYDITTSSAAGFATTFNDATGVTTRTPAALAAAFCNQPTKVITQGNDFLNVATASLVNDATGPDSIVASLADDDWALDSNAPATAKAGGRALSGTSNCGGATCGGAATAQCGPLTTDFDGITRDAGYSIGAHEF